jgi:hypothetical protein
MKNVLSWNNERKKGQTPKYDETNHKSHSDTVKTIHTWTGIKAHTVVPWKIKQNTYLYIINKYGNNYLLQTRMRKNYKIYTKNYLKEHRRERIRRKCWWRRRCYMHIIDIIRRWGDRCRETCCRGCHLQNIYKYKTRNKKLKVCDYT